MKKMRKLLAMTVMPLVLISAAPVSQIADRGLSKMDSTHHFLFLGSSHQRRLTNAGTGNGIPADCHLR